MATVNDSRTNVNISTTRYIELLEIEISGFKSFPVIRQALVKAGFMEASP